MPDNRDLLFLIPTEFERGKVKTILADRYPDQADQFAFQLCGFGPIAAAAKTTQLLAAQPVRVILLGIAGTYQTERFPVGTAAKFNHVICHGVGVGTGQQFVSAAELGWQQGDAVDDRIACTEPRSTDSTEPIGDLLTVCSAANNIDEASFRMTKNPTAVGEDMEAFGVAMACQMSGIAFEVIRGFSNVAGDRDKANWRIDEALEAAVDLLIKT